MLPDSYFEKVQLEDGTEILEHKTTFDNTIVVRRKPSVKAETNPKPTVEKIPLAPEPVADLRKLKTIDIEN